MGEKGGESEDSLKEMMSKTVWIDECYGLNVSLPSTFICYIFNLKVGPLGGSLALRVESS